MNVIAEAGREDIAMVYVGEFGGGKLVEFVEAVQPPTPREDKWVLMVSTLYGCPVGCSMCDAGGYYHGKVSADDLYAQIDFLVEKRYPEGLVPSRQFKIQFARMGEPAFNPAVIEVLAGLPKRYRAPGLMPSLSTIAPHGTDEFFERLLAVKEEHYSNGNFQFQFSIHTTDQTLRDRIIPVKKWDFARMAAYGDRFYQPGDRKITLNFALAQENPVDPQVLLRYFNPEKFLIKITPLNPTYRAKEHELSSYIDPHREREDYPLVETLQAVGYRVIVSIGEVEENYIGSNCGQYVRRHLESPSQVQGGYTYPVYKYN